jgi:predicted double-glycine peptidase
MDSYHTTTFFFKNGTTVEFGTGSATFIDGLNLTTVMVANDALLEAMADYLSKQDADTLARFVHLFTPAVLEAQA